MSEDVRFIFKTLIKVPIIIFEFYLVFNIFCFMFIYFKTLGIQYVVMQNVVENNYIPASDRAKLDDYLDELMQISFVKADDGNGNRTEIIISDPSRTQYGSVKECGVRVCYEFQWPLRPDQQTDNGVAVDGFQPGQAGARNGEEGPIQVVIPIKITYKIPGLQYYPDLNIT